MKKLVTIEVIKFWGSPTLRAMLLVHALLFFLVTLVASSVTINVQGVYVQRLFQFPHIWQTCAWFASWFNLLLGIIAIVMVTSEHQYRMFRKQLIDGLTRAQLVTVKVALVLLLALYAMCLVLIAGLSLGFLKSTAVTLHSLLHGLQFLPIIFIQSLGYMVIGMLFAFVLKNSAISIVGYILYFFPVEFIIRAIITAPINGYLPFGLMASLTPAPDFIGVTLADSVNFANQPDIAAQLPDATGPFVTIIIAIFYIVAFVKISGIIVAKRNF